MKNLTLILLLSMGSLSAFTQSVLHNNTQSVTLLPNGITTTHPAKNDISNTALGADAMKNNLYGKKNTAIGYQALHTMIGSNTPNVVNGKTNVAVGSNAMYAAISSFNNVAIGDSAMSVGSYTNNSIAIGYSALLKANNNHSNIGIGTNAQANYSTGSDNISLGRFSLNSCAGNNNIALGSSVMNGFGLSSTGSSNIAMGEKTLSRFTTASNNIALGDSSLLNTATGSKNVAIGTKNMYNNIAGKENTSIGHEAGYESTGDRNVLIGYKAGSNLNSSNNLVIENSDSLGALIRGNFETNKVGINRTRPALNSTNFTFQVDGDASKNTAGNWSSHSDRRLKKNIAYLNSQEILQKVVQLKGVTYEWNDTKTGSKRPLGLQFGFIAQELKEVFPNKIQADNNGYLMAAYGDYDPMLVESIKALKALVDAQQKYIENQAERITILEAKMSTAQSSLKIGDK